MSVAVAPINHATAPQTTFAPSSLSSKPSSQPAGPPSANTAPASAPVDTVQISSAAAQISASPALSPAEIVLQETQTYSQIVQAATSGNPTARSLLAAESDGTNAI